ncbi:MFS general substrate transporter [Ramicandelaber brevisporus]|nr:MFS general substrate transporter [Ramicandelaber brevisporus]
MKRPLAVSYASACLAALAAGTVYFYSTYSSAFIDRLGYSQLETNTIASVGQYGLYFSGPLAGYVADKFNPRVGSAVALIGVTLGYGLMSHGFRSAVSGTVGSSVSSLSMGLFFLLVGVGSQFGYMVSLAVTARNFDSDKRAAYLSVPIAMVGLSAFGFSMVNAYFFAGQPGPENLLLFMSVFMATLATAEATAIMDIAPTDTEDENGASALPSHFPSVPVKSQKKTFFRDPNALLVFLAMMTLSGTGLMYINNVGTVARTILTRDKAAPDAIKRTQSALVATLSLANFAGRISIGWLSDKVRRTWNIRGTRVFVMALMMLVMAGGQSGVRGADNINQVTFYTVCIGVAYGAGFTLVPAILGDYWGVEHLGLHQGAITIGTAIGGHMASSMFGSMYDRALHERKQDGFCDSTECYSGPFQVTFWACMFAISFLLLLAYRRRIQTRS